MTVNKYKPQFENGILKKDFIPYTQILTKVLQSNINSDCLAVWVSLQSRPEDWNLNPGQIQNQFGWGKNKTYDVLSKLIDLKLIERIQIKDENQKFVKTIYHIKDGKEFLNNQHSEPLPYLSELEKPELENSDITNNIRLQRKDIRIKERALKKEEHSHIDKKSVCPNKIEDINSPEAENIAKGKNLNINDVANKFMCYARSSGWTRNNWKAAFVKWVIDEKIDSMKKYSSHSSSEVKSTVKEWGPGHPDYDRFHSMRK